MSAVLAEAADASEKVESGGYEIVDEPSKVSSRSDCNTLGASSRLSSDIIGMSAGRSDPENFRLLAEGLVWRVRRFRSGLEPLTGTRSWTCERFTEAICLLESGLGLGGETYLVGLTLYAEPPLLATS